ncbi:hypothetical protein D3C76_1586720 [compost metagenome]
MDLIETVQIEDDSAFNRNGTGGKIGAGTPRNDGYAMFVGQPENFGNLTGIGRMNDRLGHGLEHRSGVIGIGI